MKRSLLKEILKLDFEKDKTKLIKKDELSLIVTYSEDRAKKDRHNRERGVKRLEKQLKSGKLTKSSIKTKATTSSLKWKVR